MLVVTVRSMIPMTYHEGMGSTGVGRECGQGQGADADRGRKRAQMRTRAGRGVRARAWGVAGGTGPRVAYAVDAP